MGKLQRIWKVIKGDVEYEEEAGSSASDAVSTRDLLSFMERQQSQNAEFMKAVLDASASQAKVMENYIELFKPRMVPSTTLEDREKSKAGKTEIRKSEWEGIESLQQFNNMTAGSQVGVPPEPDSL